jgi:hypothetical protein
LQYTHTPGHINAIELAVHPDDRSNPAICNRLKRLSMGVPG